MNTLRADGLRLSTFEELEMIGEAMNLLWPWEKRREKGTPYLKIMTCSESEFKTVYWGKYPDRQVEKSYVEPIPADKIYNRGDEVFACVRTKGA